MTEKESPYTWSEYRALLAKLEDETGLIRPPRVIYPKADPKISMRNPRLPVATLLKLTSIRGTRACLWRRY
jgi:hypothetical protein